MSTLRRRVQLDMWKQHHSWVFCLLAAAWALTYADLGYANQNRSSETVKAFVLAGQSNMEGKAKNSLFDYQATAPRRRTFFRTCGMAINGPHAMMSTSSSWTGMASSRSGTDPQVEPASNTSLVTAWVNTLRNRCC